MLCGKAACRAAPKIGNLGDRAIRPIKDLIIKSARLFSMP